MTDPDHSSGDHRHDTDGHGPHGDHAHNHRTGLAGAVRHTVSPHSHDYADSIDTLTADREGMRTLVIRLAGLGVTAVLEVVVVALSGSVALFADAVHNFSDALTALPLWLAFWLGRRPPDRRYTYDYGRAEDLAGLFIVAMIALSAGIAAWHAINRLLDPHHTAQPGSVAAAGVIGFAGNELVAGYRIRVGRRIGSAALVADGHHARTDGLTSLAVLAAALGSMAGWTLADPLVGLAISAAILKVLHTAGRDIFGRLMDRVDPDLIARVETGLAHAVGVDGADRVRIRWSGHELHTDGDSVRPPARPRRHPRRPRGRPPGPAPHHPPHSPTSSSTPTPPAATTPTSASPTTTGPRSPRADRRQAAPTPTRRIAA